MSKRAPDDFYRAGFEALTGAARSITKRQAILQSRLDVYGDPANWRGIVYKGPRPDGAQDGGALARERLPNIGEDCLGTLIRIAELARLTVINDGWIHGYLPRAFLQVVDQWAVYVETRPEVAALAQQGDSSNGYGPGTIGTHGDAGGPGAADPPGADPDAGDHQPLVVGDLDQSIPL